MLDMKKIISNTCSVTFLIVSMMVACSKSIEGAEKVVVMLPGLPADQALEMQAVYLGVEAKPNEMASRLVGLGGRTGDNFRESLTNVTLSGGFIASHDGRKRPEWCYYLGVTEVTEAQWASIMGGGKKTKLPKSGVTLAEVEEFLEKLNQHVYENARDKLPKLNGESGYFRLPTEAEWEFAARGGAEVDSATFDLDHPYGEGKLGQNEWSVMNAKGKVQDVGIWEKPNPVGLFDMLGNVAELTSSMYSLEYGHGRVSARVARGGHAKENQNALRSSRRTEILPCLSSSGEPSRNPMLGLRLAFGSSLFAGTNDDAMSLAWEKYIKERPVGTTDRSSQIVEASETREAEDAYKVKIANLEGMIQVLKQQGNQGEAKPPEELIDIRGQLYGAKKENNLLRVSLKKMKEDNLALSRENAASERKRVRALVRTSSASAHLVYRDNLRIKALSEIDKFQDKVDGLKKSRQANLTGYRKDVIELSEASPEIVKKELGEWVVTLLDARIGTSQQIEAVRLLGKHIQVFRSGKILHVDVLLEDIHKGIDHVE